jgi:hypothetical protein
VFADMADRTQVWQTGLEGFDMKESVVIRQWRQEGKAEGLAMGALTNARAAVVSVLQARFPDVSVSEGVRTALERTADIQQLTDWLRQAALIPSPGDFERLLISSDA